MTSANDKVASILKGTVAKKVDLTFADVANMGLRQAWGLMGDLLSFDKNPELLLRAMKSRKLRFRDCTIAKVQASLIYDGKWGLTTTHYHMLRRRGLFSMILVQQSTDDELREITLLGTTRLREIREAQHRYEKGER